MYDNVEKIDFINSIQKILQDFTIDYMSTAHNEDVYCAFDYQDVKNTFQNTNVTNKPIFHFVLLDTPQDRVYFVNKVDEGQKINLQYAVYAVINDEVYDTEKSQVSLNRLSSQFKFIYDKYKTELVRFKNVRVNHSAGLLAKNADNLYAVKQNLNFTVIKPF